MLDAALTALAQSPPAEAVKASYYAYPLVNAAHILGLATLFGAILALDLRLLGLFRQVPAQPLARVLPRVAAAGLLVALPTGVLLFSVEPFDYAGNQAFLAKLALVTLGTVHALAVHRTPGWKAVIRGDRAIPLPLRASAALSLALWTSAVVAGRMIAFWGEA
jgi:hypothetical protein